MWKLLLLLVVVILLSYRGLSDNISRINTQLERLEKQDENLELKIKEATKGAYLKRYFISKDSILVDYVDDFVRSADKYGLNLSLLPAVSMVESSGCLRYIRATNNCFGWGGGYIYFSSIGDAITRISKALKENLAYKRFQQEETIEAFAYNYNFPYAKDYTQKIRYFISEIESYK